MKMDHSYAVIQPFNKEDNVEMVILQEAPDGSILQLTYDTASKQLCTENEMVFVQLPMNEPILGEFPEEADIDNSSNVESSHFSTTNPSAESTEERFRDLFPRRYETKLVSHQDDYTNSGEYFHVRVALKTKEEFVEWLKLHQNLTGITYRVLKTTRCEGKRSVYKAKYRCQHNTLAHLRKSTKCPSKKHTACPAYLSVTIKAVPKLEKCKDPYLPCFPAIIGIYYNHNHPIHKTPTEVSPSHLEEGSDNSLPLSNSSNESHQIVELHLEDDKSGECFNHELIKTDIAPLIIRDPDLQDLEEMFKEFVHNVRRCYDSYPIEFHFAISKAKENYKRLTTDISLLNCLMEFGKQGE